MAESREINRSRSWLEAEAGMILTQIWAIIYLIGVPQPFLEPFVLLGITLLPGLNTALLLCGRRWAASLAAGLCLAPLFAGVTGYFLCVAKTGPAWAILAPALLTMPLAALAAFIPKRSTRDKHSDWGLGAAFGISLVLVLACAYLLLFSVRIRLSTHGLLHSAIVYQVIDTGVPPQNPYFAGQPLIYYWFYHLAAAGASLAAGLSPLMAFSFMNLLAAAAVAPCLYLIGRAFRLLPGIALFGTVIALLALNPLGPIIFLLREHNVTLEDVAAGIFPGHLVQGLALYFDSFSFDLRLASPLTKFWNVSSFPQGIALFLLGLLASLSPVRPAWRYVLFLFIPCIGLMLINPLAGASLIAPLGLAALAWRRKGERLRLVLILITLAAAGLASIPYLLSMTAEGQGESLARLAPSLASFLGLILAAGPVLLFACFGIVRLFGQVNRPALHLTFFCLCLTVMALLVDLPMDNQYKFIRLLLFPAGLLAAPAAWEFLCRMRIPRPAAMLLALTFLLPCTVMAFVIYLYGTHAEVPLDDRGVQIEITADDPVRREAYRILREDTPLDAVVVVDIKDRMSALGGKMQGDEVPALARRPLYTGHRFYLTERSPGFQDRVERTARLFLNREGPVPEPLEDRPLYVLVRSDQIPELLQRSRYEEIYRRDAMALFRYRRTDPDSLDD
jgi:hypothetical protein